MKYLSGIESMQIDATAQSDGRWRLDGKLPWVTNLRTPSFVVAAAVATNGAAPMVVALRNDLPGMQRSADLNLLGMRGSNTAAIRIDGAVIGAADVIHPDARTFLPRARPSFLGLQCGMSIGLARAAVSAAREFCGKAPTVLNEPITATAAGLQEVTNALYEGLADGRFASNAATLFRLRIRLAELVQRAVELELLASGGRAYLLDQDLGFARRWQEAAFIPIITPSLTQLQGELLKQMSAAQAA